MDEALIGRFAWSNAGRDKDRLFIIIGIVDNAHVLIADGDLRPLGKPKKKKLKHLRITNRVADEVSSALASRKRLNDADLRRVIACLLEERAAGKASGEG